MLTKTAVGRNLGRATGCTVGVRRSARRVATAMLLVAAVTGAVAGRTVSAQAAPANAQSDTTHAGDDAADVRFMQGMIAHHTQALTMVSLIASRASRPEMPLLGQRIAISQRDEIRMMRTWLQDHHEAVPDSSGNMPMMPGMTMGNMLMPGMLTPEQMAALAKATGPAFDQLFLEGMIRHHEGALVMVKELFATNGAAQASDIFRFASDVDADQRAEIKRMRAMLDAPPPGARRP